MSRGCAAHGESGPKRLHVSGWCGLGSAARMLHSESATDVSLARSRSIARLSGLTAECKLLSLHAEDTASGDDGDPCDVSTATLRVQHRAWRMHLIGRCSLVTDPLPSHVERVAVASRIVAWHARVLWFYILIANTSKKFLVSHQVYWGNGTRVLNYIRGDWCARGLRRRNRNCLSLGSEVIVPGKRVGTRHARSGPRLSRTVRAQRSPPLEDGLCLLHGLDHCEESRHG